ncbi:MAG: biopolymer transporter ExbD [Spirochaetaceae bacterium]|nr:MAG: biopolymer transporter ExbD [Spirochaetaceae bacterium]
MQFQRRLQPKANVDLVPMIDVVFQLVVFFMVSSTFIVTPGIALNLPESSSSESVVVTPTVVTVISTGEYYVNQEQFDLQGLNQHFLELDGTWPQDEPRGIVVEGDSQTSYESIVQVLDVLRRNNFRGVSLKTREAE